jgi:hypothetical protein
LPLQQGAPPATAGVQLVLNDKGRVGVAEKLGAAVDKVEGTLTAQSSDSYTIAVSTVYQIGGNSTKWNGEPAAIAKDWTVGYQVRRFNQTRTVVLAAALTAAVVVFFVSMKLIGSGSDPQAGGGLPGQTH